MPFNEGNSKEIVETIGDSASAAGVLYQGGNEILLLKRRDDAVQGGTWAFPAGHIEAGETEETAAKREMFEETGYKIDAEMSLVTKNSDFTLFKFKGEKFSPVLNEEHTDFIWATPENLPVPLHPGVHESLNMHGEDSARRTDMNGYVSIERNPVSRAGIFQYMGRSIGAPEPDRIYNVYRPPEELQDPETLESFKLIPIVDDHTMLGDGFTPAEKKGIHGSTGEDVFFENDTLYSNLRIFSETVKKLIERGKKHLSLGYRCVYEAASGTYNGQAYDYIQRKLRGNHLALVDQSRCDVLVLDSKHAMDYADVVISSIDSKGGKMAEEEKDKEKSEDGSVTLASLDAAVKELIEKFEELKKEKAEDEDEDKEKDKEEEEAKDESFAEQEEGGKGEDAAEALQNIRAEFETFKKSGLKALVSEISERDALAKSLSYHIGTFDHADKTLAEVAKYGVRKLGIKCSSGQEKVALDGFLHNRTKPQDQKVYSMDSAASRKGSEVLAYITNTKKVN